MQPISPCFTFSIVVPPQCPCYSLLYWWEDRSALSANVKTLCATGEVITKIITFHWALFHRCTKYSVCFILFTVKKGAAVTNAPYFDEANVLECTFSHCIYKVPPSFFHSITQQTYTEWIANKESPFNLGKSTPLLSACLCFLICISCLFRFDESTCDKGKTGMKAAGTVFFFLLFFAVARFRSTER